VRHLLITAALLAAACAPAPPPEAVAVPPTAAAAVPAASVPPPVALVAPPPAPAFVPVAAPAAPPPPVPAAAVAVAAPLISISLPVPNLIPYFVRPSPGRLTLNNFSFDRVQVEAVITASEVCNLRIPGDAVSSFELPLNGTRIIVAPPGADVCWRRRVEPAPGQSGTASAWSDWSRAYIARGTPVNARI
jgi:hypothetical protein